MAGVVEDWGDPAAHNGNRDPPVKKRYLLQVTVLPSDFVRQVPAALINAPTSCLPKLQTLSRGPSRHTWKTSTSWLQVSLFIPEIEVTWVLTIIVLGK